MSAIDQTTPPSLPKVLDRALRGDYLRPEALVNGRIGAPTGTFARLAVLLGGIYGICLGSYALFHGSPNAFAQVLSATAKVPALFLLTVAVTFPSLYVFTALQRVPLDVANTLRLLLLAILVHCAVLASLGPVFAFFSASTDSYPFLKLLNLVFFAIGGLLGLMVMRSAMRTLFAQQGEQATAAQASIALRLWCVVYCLVGAQMGWLLRPFLGSPELPFAVLRSHEGNIFVGIARTFAELFGK